MAIFAENIPSHAFNSEIFPTSYGNSAQAV